MGEPQYCAFDSRTFRDAAQLLGDGVRATDLLPLSKVTLPDGIRLSLKLECTQTSGSFKARGARHYVARLLAVGRPKGVITYSSGNHGRAVAEAARDYDLPALVTVPDHVDASKGAAMAAAGAEVVHAGPTSTSRYQKAVEIAAQRGWEIIPPFDHPWIVAGQGTVGLEIVEQAADVVAVWVPVGGGGLSAGVATAIRALKPGVQVFTVEPSGAAALAESLRRGQRVTLKASDSVADGLLPLSIGELNFELLQRAGVTATTVDDAEILRTLSFLRGECGVESEPSGAVASTPLLTDAHRRVAQQLDSRELPRGHHVAVVSGGNVDPDRLQRLLHGL